ncbi:MAG TPA: ribosome recycling factor [Nitrospira sp.]|nr:ribosome recycling factor [Nitrospira sp.]
MQKTLESLRGDLQKIRTGRAHTGLLDHVMVDYYGSLMPVNQVANVTLVDARTIGVQPWEKNMVQKVEKAIRDSDLGLNPASQGELIRVPMPPLTEERRKDLIKVCKKHGEEMKVQIRGFRRDGNEELKKLQKDAKLTEDELRKSETEIQKFTDQYVQKIDDMMKKKEGEILEV